MPRQTLTVSSRGQITLPAGLRKRLGIQPGGVVAAEERGGELGAAPGHRAGIGDLHRRRHPTVGRGGSPVPGRA